MKMSFPRWRALTSTATGITLIILAASPIFGQGSAFVYQGRLVQGTGSASGLYEMQFTLFDAPTNGNQIASPVALAPVEVSSNGLFSATLDFGNTAFNGQGRWLEITLSVFGSDMAPVRLIPRQPITAVPHAMVAGKLTGTLASSNLSGIYTGALRFSNPGNEFIGNFFGNGAALSNVNATTLCGDPCNMFWRVLGNAGTAAGLNFLGTTDDEPLELKVFGQRVLRLEPTTNTPNVIGGFEGNYVTPGLYGVTIAGGGGAASGVNVVKIGDRDPPPHFATISGGGGHQISQGTYDTIGGGLKNSIGGGLPFYHSKNTICGGAGNSISEGLASTIAGGENNVMSAAHDGAAYCVIGGGFNNLIDGTGWPAHYDTIAGGARNIIEESVYSAIGGGERNWIYTFANYSTIAGGQSNRIDYNAVAATISGGRANFIADRADGATIGGGVGNRIALPSYPPLEYATIPGGRDNVAVSYAFAAGRRAKAINQGAFVWADSQDADFQSTVANQFLIRAAGGVGIGTTQTTKALDVRDGTGPVGSGGNIHIGTTNADGDPKLIHFGDLQEDGNGYVYIGEKGSDDTMELRAARYYIREGRVGIRTETPASALEVAGTVTATSFNTSSDRSLKTNCAPVDALATVEKVAALPIHSWEFTTDPDGRHIGPMAQDFHAAFRCGNDDKHINLTDANGIALAAIQGLHQMVLEQQKDLLRRDQEILQLQQRLSALEASIKHASSR